MHLVVIDTKAGNFGSVLNALKKVGASVEVTQDKTKIQAARALVLPGVSAFKHGMDELRRSGLVDTVRTQATTHKVPLIGICLGMQLLAETGTEGAANGTTIEGLGLIGGQVTRLTATPPERIPNIGWHDVTAAKHGVLFPAAYKTSSFYHVHSYALTCRDPRDVAATIAFSGQNVTVAVERDNVFGVQFHPEKSQDAGLDLLERFIKAVA